MTRKTNIYRVIVRQNNGRLLSYDESATSASVVVEYAPFELVQVQQIDAETGSVLRVVYPTQHKATKAVRAPAVTKSESLQPPDRLLY